MENNNKILAAGAFTVLALFVVFAIQQQELTGLAIADEGRSGCIDLDNGNNPSVKGGVEVFGEILGDYCRNKVTVVEMLCDKRGKSTSQSSTCPNGCQDGVCREGPLSKCTDSDGGLDINAQGTVNELGNEFVDACRGSKQVVEWFCDPNSGRRGYVATCDVGCQNGACVGKTLGKNLKAVANIDGY